MNEESKDLNYFNFYKYYIYGTMLSECSLKCHVTTIINENGC